MPAVYNRIYNLYTRSQIMIFSKKRGEIFNRSCIIVWHYLQGLSNKKFAIFRPKIKRKLKKNRVGTPASPCSRSVLLLLYIHIYLEHVPFEDRRHERVILQFGRADRLDIRCQQGIGPLHEDYFHSSGHFSKIDDAAETFPSKILNISFLTTFYAWFFWWKSLVW